MSARTGSSTGDPADPVRPATDEAAPGPRPDRGEPRPRVARPAVGGDLPWQTLAVRLRQDAPAPDGTPRRERGADHTGRHNAAAHRPGDVTGGRHGGLRPGDAAGPRHGVDPPAGGRAGRYTGRRRSTRGPGATAVTGERRHGRHRAHGRLVAYRQPALLLALIVAAALLVTDPPAPRAPQPLAGSAARPAPGDPRPGPAGAVPQQVKPAPGGPRDEPATPAPSVSAQPTAAATPSGSARPPTGPPASATRSLPVTGPAGSARVTGSDAVALTFDDGPDPEQTPKLLDLLAQSEVKATFCVVGERVQEHPELIRRMAAEGHSLCNHSWEHDFRLGMLTPEEIRADLTRTTAAIRAAAPGVTVAYFRAPGGNFTPGLVAAATEQGMRSIYWQVDPRDWDQPDGEPDDVHRARIVAHVQSHTTAGAIVLSHDYGQPQTVAAYAELLPVLKQRFRLIPLT